MARFAVPKVASQSEPTSHSLLDGPTIRVGRITGGSSVNLTPDSCIVDFDIRLPPGVDHQSIVKKVSAIAPQNVTIGILDFKPAVESSANDDFVQLCSEICTRHRAVSARIKGVAYYSDATVLLEGLSVPFAIIGPGELGMSGQPDESVSIANVLKAVRIYEDVALTWLA